ncbi:MAG TPA: hypothetical protein VNZ27_13450 [Rhodanobacter sp.]|jgi:hypothetical protein|nr:hypothetical protein [Rhodanobacter sp.]
MPPIPARIRLRQSCGALLLGALVVGQLLCTAHAKDTASNAFDGYWTYNNDCHYGHYAEIRLTQKGADVTGDWSDGTRLSGSDGSLKGHIRGDKLFVRYCGGDEHAGYAVCPKYEAEESDYLVRQGSDLVWYRGSGQGSARTFEKYVALHPSVKGKRESLDNDCPSDDN